MSLFSKQKIFCNACGKEMFEALDNVMGRKYKCCSSECIKEMEWRRVLSILGKEYYSRPPELRGCSFCKMPLGDTPADICEECAKKYA